jgi:uncharacterized protein YlaI
MPVGAPLIHLVLCLTCRLRVSDPSQSKFRDGWHGLPPFCPECEAKVTQSVRILASGGVILPNPEQVRIVPGGAFHEARKARKRKTSRP